MLNKDLRKQVLTVLRDYPETRNSDITLTIEIWKRFYNTDLILGKDGKTHYISVYKLFELPREDNVKRVRAKIQNEERKYLPTNYAIFEKRASYSKEWRKFLGYYGNYYKDVFLEKLEDYYESHQRLFNY